MKLIAKILILFLALSAISSKRKKAYHDITAAVLASPEAFANAIVKIVSIPNEFRSKLEEVRQSVSRFRKEMGTAIMINVTKKECSVRCKDGNSLLTHFLTIRGRNTVGPHSTMNINASGQNFTMRCYVKCGDDDEKGPHTMTRGGTYTWNGKALDLFIPK